MKLGVLGGTFNPIHIAHVRMAEEYAGQLGLDKLILMPTYIPPHKKAKGLASAEDRLAMCRLAVYGLPLFEVSDYEIRQSERSYTFKTLWHLRERYKDAEIFLLMGADMFITVQDWKHPKEIFKAATLCAAQRERGEFTLLDAHRYNLEIMGAKCLILDMDPLPLSSTAIRDGIAAGEDVSELLHPDVMAYIRQKGLYRTKPR